VVSSDYGKHYSVQRREVLKFFSESLGDRSVGPTYLDLTFGAGGHTTSILKEIPNSFVYAVDQDIEAINNGETKLKELDLTDRCKLLKMNFSEFEEYYKSSLSDEGVKFDGILMDLGVSSHQFDQISRGFSFRESAELDMRMDGTNDQIQTAKDLVNELDEEELANVIFEYGEERYSRRIAKAIVEKREEAEIVDTKTLEDIVFHCYPKKDRFKKIHPATKTFQALRIAVNHELEVLATASEFLPNFLAPGGRLAIISFHSLEDRIVKRSFKKRVLEDKAHFKILTKRPLMAEEDEVSENPRSRSAKMRVLEKL